jgi:hypothetical protein
MFRWPVHEVPLPHVTKAVRIRGGEVLYVDLSFPNLIDG